MAATQNSPGTTPGLAPASGDALNQAYTGAVGQTPSGSLPSAAPSPTPAAPAEAESAFETQGLESDNYVRLGSQLATSLGLSATQGYSIGSVVSAFNELSSGQLTNLETLLWNAGMYVDAEGDPVTTAPAFGSHDSQSIDALLNLLLQTTNAEGTATTAGQAGAAKVTATDVLSGQISSGAGAAQRQAYPSPVVGGANAYQVNLSNPEDIYQTAVGVFQSALGRNPTQGELNNLVSSVQSGDFTTQVAANTQKETAAKAQFAAQVNSRNAETEAETSPHLANGNVPSGPFTTPAEYAIALLQYLGDQDTQENVQTVTGWIEQSGQWGTGSMNPLGSKLGASGSQTNATTGVQQYASWAQSIQSTADALQDYPNVTQALKSGNSLTALATPAVSAEISKWSDGAFANLAPAAAKAKGAATVAIKDAPRKAATAAQTTPGQTVTTPGQVGPKGQETAPGTGNSFPGDPNLGLPLSQAAPVSTTTPGTVKPEATTPAADVSPGQTQSAPGDVYVAPTTLTQTEAPSASDAAFTAATTGANQTEYLGNQYLDNFATIVQMIQNARGAA